MTVQQIRYFLTVAQENSFSNAAQILFVSQPAVSRQVAQLERELGVSLFTRTNQGIAITEAGEAYADFFRRAGQEFQTLTEQVRSRGNTVSGAVNIGCTEGWDLSSFFPQLSESLAQRYPKLRLNLSGYNQDNILHALERGKADVVITSESLLQDREKIDYQVLTYRRGMLLFSAHNPLAKKEGLCLADFKNEPFYVTTPPNMNDVNLELYTLCAKADFSPILRHEPTLSSVYMKLSSGRGAFLCNDWMLSITNPLFSALPLEVDRGICVAWMKENESSLVKLMVRELTDWFEETEQ